MSAHPRLICLLAVVLGLTLLPALRAQSAPTYESRLIEARRLFGARQLPEALAVLQAAGRQAPERFEASALAAIVLQAAGRTEEARQALAEAVKRAPAAQQPALQEIARTLEAAPVPPAPASQPPEQKRAYNVLLLIFDEAERATEPAARRKLVEEFLIKARAYLATYNDDRQVWPLYALYCLELDQVDEGILAARWIQHLKLTESDDPKIMRLVAALDRKGWFTAKTSQEIERAKQESERAAAAAKAERFKRYEGKPVIISDMGLELLWVPYGTFLMGTGSGDEGPQLTVTLSSYWLGKTEVTQAQWRAIMGNNPSSFNGDDRPVENVSWEDAMEFCRKLTERERAAGRLPDDYAYTLPTEAQWENACRAGTNGDYAGDLIQLAWFEPERWTEETAKDEKQLSRAERKALVGQIREGRYVSAYGGSTKPVAGKKPNDWGFYDMHGNVSEWCHDWYKGDYKGYAGGTTVTNPVGPTSGTYRVSRGGSWSGSATNCRSAFRDWFSPGNRYYDLGFRVALSSVQ
jgi:formylglycine-generating enzyme required for sulfatase activity